MIVKNEFLGIKRRRISAFLFVMVLSILKFTLQKGKKQIIFLSTVK
jgi:hypothetical protein